MKEYKWIWAVRILAGAGLGLFFSVAMVPYIMSTRSSSPLTCLLCAALGAAAGAATLPFADDGKSLLLRSGAHFAATAVLFALLLLQFEVEPVELLAWECILALFYAVVWLGRWIGWYVEVMQLRTMLGLAPGPSPLKWRETLPYLAFALMIQAGLLGMERALELSPAADLNLYQADGESLSRFQPLPQDRAAAVAAARSSEFIRSAVPEAVAEEYFKNLYS